MGQLIERFSRMHRALDLTTVGAVCLEVEVEAKGPEVQGHPWLQEELEASPGYMKLVAKK